MSILIWMIVLLYLKKKCSISIYALTKGTSTNVYANAPDPRRGVLEQDHFFHTGCVFVIPTRGVIIESDSSRNFLTSLFSPFFFLKLEKKCLGYIGCDDIH